MVPKSGLLPEYAIPAKRIMPAVNSRHLNTVWRLQFISNLL